MKRKLGKIVGRSSEIKILSELYESKQAEFVAVYGRRRVGKTFLIKNYFEERECVFVYASGMKDGSMKDQLQNFTEAIEISFFEGMQLQPFTTWRTAFKKLSGLVAKLPLNKKVVLFLDELPWLATKKSSLLEALDYYWNRFWSHDERFKLIVCGSSVSWIINNIISNKGGLYNRVTQQIKLDPFTLNETLQFLKSKAINVDVNKVLELYMIMGGIPYYLNHIQAKKSVVQNISDLAFKQTGVLYRDFEHLFHAIFDDSLQYLEIVDVLSKHRYGVNQDDLIDLCKTIKKGGRASEKIQNLESAGFVVTFLPYSHKKRGISVKIVDEYILFYKAWIESYKRQSIGLGDAKDEWLFKNKSPGWKAWSGYTFEMICLKHTLQIKRALRIPESSIASTWKKQGGKEEGAQIDLLFDRPDGAITICEIKYTEKPFKIDKAYYRELKRKVEVFQGSTKTKKEVFVAIVSSSGLQPSIYSEEYLSGVVTLEDLFDC